jgi:ABC-type uncharacterized transport system permease subunit
MLGLLQILDILLPVGYAAVVGAYLVQFFRDEGDEMSSARFGLYALIAVHATYFVLRGIELGFMPFGTKADFLSLVALSIGIVYGVIEKTQAQSRTGAFFLVPAFAGQTIASVFVEYSKKHPLLLENPIYGVHVIFMVLGLTALAVGALYALMYVLLSRQLKARELGMFFKRLPPLMKLEKMSRVGTVAGVVVLGLGLGLGYMVGATIEEFNLMDPKFIVSDVIWLGYLAGVVIAKVRGLSGMQAAWATMIWFTIFLASVGVANHSFA